MRGKVRLFGLSHEIKTLVGIIVIIIFEKRDPVPGQAMRLGVSWWQQNSGAGQGRDGGAGWVRKQEQNPTEGSVQKVTESHQLVCVNGKMSGMSHSKGRTLNELPNLSWKNESSTKLSSTDTESPLLRNRHYLCSSARGKRGLSAPLSQNSINFCHCFQHKHWVWGEKIIKWSRRLKK